MKASLDKSKLVKAIYNEKRLTVVFSALFVLSLLPIFVIAFYSRPGVDDFKYGADTRIAYMTTHNIATVLAAAIETVIETYYAWQGTFSSVFLFSLQPGAFNEAFYPLTTFIMLSMLIGSTVFLLQTVIVGILGLDRKYVVLTGVPILFFCIQCLPLARHAFFWYNGSVHYTFFYSLMLFLLGLCIRLYRFQSVSQ
ncbi:MAG: hypothetical protein LBI54_05355 [Lachnospiraceae bacterium]|jgi:hypothetical protein|nr:hypothetical protein [Lachnospiraceae bacterium]